MERSEQIGDLVSNLAKAQLEFGAAIKDSANPYYNSKYADLATVISATRPALGKHGIAVMHSCTSDIERQVATVTTSIHLGEQWISSTAEAPAIGKAKEGGIRFDAQTIGAAWTYLRRYTLQGLLSIASEDDDGNALVTEKTPPPASKKPAGPSPEDRKMWSEAFAECQTLEEWNKLIVPMMKERYDDPRYGKPFVVAAAEEAKRRGYVGDRATGLYAERKAS